jgi:membrane protein
MVFIFALLYKYSPCVENRRKIKLRNTLPGSLFSALGWMITSIIFSYYVNNFSRYTVTYGSVGGIIVLLIWLYIVSIIVVLGGEINATIEYFKINGLRKNNNKSIVGRYLRD